MTTMVADALENSLHESDDRKREDFSSIDDEPSDGAYEAGGEAASAAVSAERITLPKVVV